MNRFILRTIGKYLFTIMYAVTIEKLNEDDIHFCLFFFFIEIIFMTSESGYINNWSACYVG